MSKNSPKSSPGVILASASERRKNMLLELGISFETRVSAIVESWARKEPPRQIAVRLAMEKAESVNDGQSLVIGMDTIVVSDGKILGKPDGADDVRRMLRQLSGKMHSVITGLTLLYANQRVTSFEETKVYFRALKKAEIEWYLKTGEPLGKAGAYAIQGQGRIFVSEVNGCYYNVVGFPLHCFQESLKKLGLNIFDLMPRL